MRPGRRLVFGKGWFGFGVEPQRFFTLQRLQCGFGNIRCCHELYLLHTQAVKAFEQVDLFFIRGGKVFSHVCQFCLRENTALAA